MGIVYAAYDPHLDRRIALKVLRPRRGSAPRLRDRARLEREAQAMARLSHPNVIAVHDVAESDGELFLAMEFVDGETLKRWLERQKRPWTEVIEVFVAAGEGLAAAHRAGLIHRDFKPDNVLVDHEGRVRVTDFGLARAGDSVAPSELIPALAVPSSASSSVARRITHAGALLGTPAYMSPEQHARLDLDARSDQFSFCVALYEALFDAHPFDGETVTELAAAVSVGRVREPPRDHAVPAPVRRALLRGLSRRPDDRFPSMEPLLEALRIDPRGRRRNLALGTAGIAIALVTGGLVYATTHAESTGAEEPCSHAAEGIDAIWNEGRSDAVRDAFGGTEHPAAQDSFARTKSILDAYAESWRAQAAAACRATRVDNVQSDESLDLRMSCLGRRLDELDASLTIFADADAALVVDAAEAASRLIPVSVCEDPERLRGNRVPDDPSLRDKAQALLHEAAELRALRLADRSLDPVRAERLVADTVALGIPAIESQARQELGLFYVDASRFDDADAAFNASAARAAEAGDDAQVADAMIARLDLFARVQPRYVDALVFAPAVEAAVIRAGDQPDQRLRLHMQLGAAYLGLGKLDEAEREYGQASEIAQGDVGSMPTRAAIWNNLGAVAFSRGHFDEARERFLEALAFRRKYQGELHVDYAEGLYNVGNTYLSTGKAEEGKRELDHALEVLATITTRPTQAEAGVRNSLAVAHMSMGELDAARREARAALDIFESLHGEQSPTRAGPLLSLAQLDILEGDLDRAERTLEGLTQTLRDQLGPDHPHIGLPLGLRGRIALERGDHDAARRDLDAALAQLDALEPSHPWRLGPTADLLRVDLEQNVDLSSDRRVDDLLQWTDGGHEDRQELARVWWIAARVLARSQPDRSRRIARRALALLRENGSHPQSTLDALEVLAGPEPR